MVYIPIAIMCILTAVDYVNRTGLPLGILLKISYPRIFGKLPIDKPPPM